MPAERVSMRQAREIIRLKFSASLPTREIARRLGLAPSTVRETLSRLESAGLCRPLPEGIGDAELEAALYANRRSKRGHRRHAEPDWPAVHRELKRKHVTLLIVWDEYIAANPGGYSYSRFCELYRGFEAKLSPTMRQMQGARCDHLSYCVADAEFAVAEADFIFAPERLNVAVTRARTKLIVIISRRLLDTVSPDQEQMDKAELLREFVFSATPKGETFLRDVGGGQVKVQLRLLGFDDSRTRRDWLRSPPRRRAPRILTSELEDMLGAVKASALASRYGTATIGDLQRRLATRSEFAAWLGRASCPRSHPARPSAGTARSLLDRSTTRPCAESLRQRSSVGQTARRRGDQPVSQRASLAVLRNRASAFRVDEWTRRRPAQACIRRSQRRGPARLRNG